MLPRPALARRRPDHPGRPTVRAHAAALAVVLAAVTAGCSVAEKNQAPVAAATSSATAVDESVPAGLRPFYEQRMDWSACGEFQCATATVPIDYADPDAGTIELALKRAPATGDDVIGSLLINPGGPGASGVDFVESAVTRISPEVLARYDVVGFDPRGVARSSPVTCLDAPEKDALISRDFDFSTDAGIAEAVEAYAALGAACAANTGPLLAHVGTQSAARDMDVLRAALGDEQLHYLGYSYGTSLGATYAGLFPERVGRLVLDGAVDPSLTSTELSVGQAVGFEEALRAYVRDCQAGQDCPLTGTLEEGLAQVAGLVERAQRNPLPTDLGRPLTGALAFYGIALTLYDDQSWPILTQALAAALGEDDGTILLRLADIYNDRNEDGTFATNSTEAFRAVGCLDGASSADPEAMRAEAAEILEAAPTLGEYFTFGGVVCAEWPAPPTGAAQEITAEDAAPVLVIGTTNDPATPYAWSQGLAEQLDSGVLLTWQGEGHTAYGRSNECVADVVDAYLLQGTVPEEGVRC